MLYNYRVFIPDHLDEQTVKNELPDLLDAVKDHVKENGLPDAKKVGIKSPSNIKLVGSSA